MSIAMWACGKFFLNTSTIGNVKMTSPMRSVRTTKMRRNSFMKTTKIVIPYPVWTAQDGNCLKNIREWRVNCKSFMRFEFSLRPVLSSLRQAAFDAQEDPIDRHLDPLLPSACAGYLP